MATDVGKDFDDWLDWNGKAESSLDQSSVLGVNQEGTVNPTDTLFPVSPSSSTNTDRRQSFADTQGFTASYTNLPTPEQSSSSPEASSCIVPRQSRDYLAVAPRPQLKRKLSPNDVPALVEPEGRPANKKRPHNVIEKRYRANLNSKIAELRDSVPRLRSIKRAQAGGEDVVSSDDELDGVPSSGKLNKASILSKAVEYIHQLEMRNKSLDKDNESLKTRLQTLEKVLEQGGNQAQRLDAFTSQEVIESSSTPSVEARNRTNEDSQPSSHPPQGMIPVPDAWRRLRETQNSSQEHYGHTYDVPSERSILKGKWPTRVMLGSLAGLMLMEGFGESDSGTTSKGKGLFGIPLELLDGYSFLLSPRTYMSGFVQYCRHGGVFPLVKGFCALSILAFFVFAYLFNSKPNATPKLKEETPTTPQESTLTSPIDVRRRAWSTSMQVLGLPHHHFFNEWTAVTLEWMKYSVRYLFGMQVYTWVTGRCGEDEIARIKAWDIATDAQLAGGDPEISRSRVLLTSFGAGNMPRTPLRLMLKALHCRVLLWQVGGSPNSAGARIATFVASFFANREWLRAIRLHEVYDGVDRLPPYLVSLLDQDADDVFSHAIIQRAYNLMYDRPTAEDCEDQLMDVVVEDHAIKSPLDAIAAWCSTQALEKALHSSIEHSPQGDTAKYLQIALSVAPPGSAAQTRALALHALFYSEKRGEHISKASSALSSTTSPTYVDGPYFIDSSTPASARPEISCLLQCTQIITELESNCGPNRCASTSNLEIDVTNMSLLSFTGLTFFLQRLNELEDTPSHSPLYVQVASLLNQWLAQGDKDKLPKNIISKTRGIYANLNFHTNENNNNTDFDDIEARRRMSHDTGYESGEEVDREEDDHDKVEGNIHDMGRRGRTGARDS